jgi:hypothetical protein
MDRLSAMDAFFNVYDTLPTETKEERQEKNIVFDSLMRVMKQKNDIEQDLNTLWNLR